MRHNNFNIGDKVVTIIDGELCKGVIKNIYLVNPPVYAVELEDGNIRKVHCVNVALDTKAETPEEKREPVEKAEITITPNEFRDIACRVIADELKNRKTLGLACAAVVGKIHRALFIESDV